MAIRNVYYTGFDESSGKTIDADTCPECTGSLRTDGGEIACTECGLVVDVYRIDHGPEWRDFEDSAAEPRTGPPLTNARHDRGLSTEIGYGGDANGNPLSARKRRRIERLRTQHSRGRWQTKADRNLAFACTEIRRMTSALDLPRSIREEASVVYRRAHEADLIQGRSIDTIAAASVYAACRIQGLPRHVEEVASVSPLDVDKVKLGYRLLNAELGLDAQAVNVNARISKLATACDVPGTVEHRAAELADLAEASGIANGRNPDGVAGGCLYLAGQEAGIHVTQRDLAAAADVSPVTIRKRYYELRDALADNQR